MYYGKRNQCLVGCCEVDVFPSELNKSVINAKFSIEISSNRFLNLQEASFATETN